MSLEENKAIIRRFYEALNKRDLSLLDDLVASVYIDHTYQSQDPEGGYLNEMYLEGLKQSLTKFYKGFPDWIMTIDDIIAEGDKVWVRFKATGTHTGKHHGLAPTGKKITETGVDIMRIVDGKIVEGWRVHDHLDYFKQLGVIEYKGFPEDVS